VWRSKRQLPAIGHPPRLGAAGGQHDRARRDAFGGTAALFAAFPTGLFEQPGGAGYAAVGAYVMD